MKEETIVTSSLRPAPSFVRRVSWGAIFAGLVVGMVTQIVLSLLGIAIGATAFNAHEANPTAGYGTGAAIWLGISMLISAFVGACVAGRLSGGPRSTDGMLHGIVSWCSATLLTAYLLTTALGSLLGGAGNVLGKVVSSGSQAAASASNQSGMSATAENLKQQITAMWPQAAQVLPPTGREGSQTNLMAQAAQNPELMSALTAMFKKGGAQAAPEERQRAIALMVNNGMSQEQASSTIDRMDQQYQQTKAKARDVGEKASEGISGAAWGGFALLLLSAALAAYGGWLGTRGLSYIRDETAAASTMA